MPYPGDINNLSLSREQLTSDINLMKMNGLLENAIVLILGDLWIPGMKSTVYEGMSSHMDAIPARLMKYFQRKSTMSFRA